MRLIEAIEDGSLLKCKSDQILEMLEANFAA
jgi:hypothetical protein